MLQKLTHTTTPQAKRADTNYLYAKADGELYMFKADGTEVKLLHTNNVPSAAAQWPIGSIFCAVVSTNPNALLGFGTWQRFAQGRILIGLNEVDADFDTVEEEGGAKEHTLTVGEMPSHTHTQDSHNHTQNSHNHGITAYQESTPGSNGVEYTINGQTNDTKFTDSTTATNQAATATNQNTGGGAAHSIMNPYIVVYMWKRTA